MSDDHKDLRAEMEDGSAPETTEPFDAIAAAAELEAALAAGGEEPGEDRYQQLEAEAAELSRMLEARQAALEQAEARATRAQDEIGRAAGRLQREAERAAERRVHGLLLDLLELLDDLDRTLEAARQDQGCRGALLDGAELVRRRFAAVLENRGVRLQAAEGERFDPALHEAVSTMTAAPEREGTVVAVVRPGFTLDDVVLRPARVVVGKLAP